MNRLLQNEDCTQIFMYRPFAKGKAGESIDRYYDVLAGAGVTELFCNINARCTNYHSAAWESFWQGYDPEGSDDQPALKGVPKESVPNYRKLIGNMQAVHNEGVDYPARVIARCRHHGIVPWLSIRMNDVHETNNPEHPFHGTFWKSHPELRRQGATGWHHSAYDYAHPEVRDHFKALIAEVLERYDMDGLELDFMRDPYLFSVGREAEGGRILTAWMREIRELVDAATARHGHAVKLGVRVPSGIGVALGLGMDVCGWARDGLLDLIVLTLPHPTSNFDVPVREWREKLGSYKGDLVGCLDVVLTAYPGSGYSNAMQVRDGAYARGGAIRVHQEKLDAVYLFNHFQPGEDEAVAEYQMFMQSLAAPDQLMKKTRAHAVTFRPTIVPGEDYSAPLPATGKDFAFALSLGPKPEDGRSVSVRLALEAEAAAPKVQLNGVACVLDRKVDAAPRRVSPALCYSAPPTAVGGANSDTVEITVADGTEIKLVGVEVTVG